jgi:hypothetical protein
MQKMSLILIVLMVVSCDVVLGFSGGDGSKANPYQIGTHEDLIAVNNDLTASYVLVKDIDVSGFISRVAVIASDSENTYSGTFQGESFSGEFDGDKYKITGLRIDGELFFTGLFGMTSQESVIKNLTVESSSVGGWRVKGMLVGQNHGRIINCHASGNITGDAYVGALVGTNSGYVINCSSSATMTGRLKMGILAGQNQGLIYNCHTSGTISGDASIGGLVGANSGYVINSSSSADVSGRLIGDFIGKNTGYVVDDCGYTYTSLAVVFDYRSHGILISGNPIQCV